MHHECAELIWFRSANSHSRHQSHARRADVQTSVWRCAAASQAQCGLGRPLRLVLTPGNTSDVNGADLLIGETAGMKRVIADRGYDANRIRAALREQGTIPVIPGRRNRKRPIQYDERRYKDRWRAEAMFCRQKDFRCIATQYDKLARNFLSAVSLAAAEAFWL